jgi:hypothetical protein
MTTNMGLATVTDGNDGCQGSTVVQMATDFQRQIQESDKQERCVNERPGPTRSITTNRRVATVVTTVVQVTTDFRRQIEKSGEQERCVKCDKTVGGVVVYSLK